MLRFSLALLLLLVAWPANADTTREEIRDLLVSSCKAWGTCGQYFRHRRFADRHHDLRRWRPMEITIRPQHNRDWRSWREDDWRRFEDRRVTEEDRKRDGFRCVGVDIEVLSEQRTTKEQGINDGVQKWMARTQWVYGGQYMDIGESARFRHRCGPTQPPGDGAALKAADVVNKGLEYVPGTPQRRAARDGEETGQFRCEIVAMACRPAREWKDRDDDDRKRRRK